MSSLIELAETLRDRLLKREWRCTCAESCTGGMLSSQLLTLSGASAWFDRGFITYSEQSKHELLGVSQQTLAETGTVSEATALAMAVGALANSEANLSIAITGVAGPTGGTASTPVGTVWIACAVKGKAAQAQCYHFKGDRDAVRTAAVEAALKQAIDSIKDC